MHAYQLGTHKFTLPRLLASSIPLSVDLAVCSAPPSSVTGPLGGGWGD